jgi:hypothetical protein
MREALLMQDALESAVGSGDHSLAQTIANAIRASEIDPTSIGTMRALRAIEGQPMEVMQARRFDDMDPATTQAIDKSVRSHDSLRSGRTANLRNQPFARPAGNALRDAAQDSIRAAQQASASENLGRAAALAGGAGLAGMIADTTDRMRPSPEGIGDLDSTADEVDFTPLERPMPQMDAGLDSVELTDDPMATADLVQESRPLPASTPQRPMTAEEAAEQFLSDARAQIQRLNEYRMSGSLPPEIDQKMSDEIQRMLELYNEARGGL